LRPLVVALDIIETTFAPDVNGETMTEVAAALAALPG
jgi:hypothetical protein